MTMPTNIDDPAQLDPADGGELQTSIELNQPVENNLGKELSKKKLMDGAGEAAGVVGAVASTGSIAAATTAACLTSGCIIASMSAAGAVFGASAAAGPMLIAGAPAYVGTKTINKFVFTEREGLSQAEIDRRAVARRATGYGGLIGVLGIGAITLSEGLSTPAVVGRLVRVGALVGGGSMTGAVLLALLPVATAGAFGATAYGTASTKRSRLGALRKQALI